MEGEFQIVLSFNQFKKEKKYDKNNDQIDTFNNHLPIRIRTAREF